MSTHASASIPGGPMTLLVEKRYWQRYAYISKRWIGYRNFKHDIIAAGFLTLATLHHVDRAITKAEYLAKGIWYCLEVSWIEFKKILLP